MKNYLYIIIFALSSLNALEDHWQSTKYVWSMNFALTSDTPPLNLHDEMFYSKSYKKIKSGDIVWVQANKLVNFYHKILPKIKKHFVLVTNISDDSFPNEVGLNFPIEKLINHPLVIHIFAQNISLKKKHPKVSSIPIGVDFHTLVWRPQYFSEIYLTPSQQENQLDNLLETLSPTDKRIPKAYVDFHLSDSIRNGCLQRYKELGEDRIAIFHKVLKSGRVDYCTQRMSRSELWKIKGQYAFSISPHGNGLDCHRTWEDLILGCIVIVKTSPLDCLYRGLPVVIVQDWSEITPENMEKWLEQYGDAFTNSNYRKRLTHKFWMQKIIVKALPYRNLSWN